MEHYSRQINAGMKAYFRERRLSTVCEALLTGLYIMKPKDHYQYLIDKLREIKESSLQEVQWDEFIDEEFRPKKKLTFGINIDYLLGLDGEDMPTPEMYAIAYDHFYRTLKKIYFKAWIEYCLMKVRKRQELREKMALAANYYNRVCERKAFLAWKNWVHSKKQAEEMAKQKLKYVSETSLGRLVIEEWYNATQESIRQREYFERLELGEELDESMLFMDVTGEAHDSISLLPQKVATAIFSHVDVMDLARCARVCRAWKILTHAPKLWNQMNLSKIKNRVTDTVACQLISKCRPFLMHVNLRGCSLVTSETFYYLSSCHNLQDLNVSECDSFNDMMLKMVTMHCLILVHLNLSYTSITDAGMKFIAKFCYNLQFLSLAFCTCFTDKGLKLLAARKCGKNIEYLDLSGCLQLTPDGFQKLTSCINLRSFIINDFPILQDSCVQGIFDVCTKIEYVSILGSPQLTDETFKKLSKAKQLRVIKIEANHKISDTSLKQLTRSCSNLRHVYLADCQKISDTSLKYLSTCKNLVVLNVADCVRITDVGVRYLTDGACSAKLRELNLTNCMRIGDVSIVQINKRERELFELHVLWNFCFSYVSLAKQLLRNLTYLSICYCDQIKESSLKLLGQSQKLISVDITGCNCGDKGIIGLGANGSLKDITISECENITDLGLQKLAQQCKEVERLDLSHCKQLTDNAIKTLVFCCRLLNYVNLAGCKLVTDLSLQYLSAVCNHLMKLDLSGCPLITDKGLKCLRKQCTKLVFLKILCCKGITNSAAHKIKKVVKKVEYSSDNVPVY